MISIQNMRFLFTKCPKMIIKPPKFDKINTGYFTIFIRFYGLNVST